MKPTNARPAPSLRRQLLFWLLPLYAVAMLSSTVAVYLIIVDASADSLDQGLADAVGLYAQHTRAHPEAIGAPELPATAQRVLLVTPEDRMFFSLRDASGGLLAGEPDLPDAEHWGTLAVPVYFNAQYRGYWLRGVSVVFAGGGRPLQLILATTALKRDKLLGDILLGMGVPQALVFFVTATLVWAVILHGLAPLESLRSQLAQRSARDLRPLDAERAPAELRPIIVDMNMLMARLDQAIAAQRNFIADAAHQLRTPIAGLLAQLEAQRPADDGNAALLATAQRLSRLVTQLLALARAEPGGVSTPTEFELAPAIHAVADEWLPAAFRRNMEVQFDVAEGRLVGSPQAFHELLSNLLDNAIRYGRDGGHIAVRCLALPGEVIVQVDDDGPGIPAHARSQVFERFFRLPGAAADGCGLGLAIVAGRVRQFEGSVTLHEAPGLGGLRVEVRLPVGPGCKRDVRKT